MVSRVTWKSGPHWTFGSGNSSSSPLGWGHSSTAGIIHYSHAWGRGPAIGSKGNNLPSIIVFRLRIKSMSALEDRKEVTSKSNLRWEALKNWGTSVGIDFKSASATDRTNTSGWRVSCQGSWIQCLAWAHRSCWWKHRHSNDINKGSWKSRNPLVLVEEGNQSLWGNRNARVDLSRVTHSVPTSGCPVDLNTLSYQDLKIDSDEGKVLWWHFSKGQDADGRSSR